MRPVAAPQQTRWAERTEQRRRKCKSGAFAAFDAAVSIRCRQLDPDTTRVGFGEQKSEAGIMAQRDRIGIAEVVHANPHASMEYRLEHVLQLLRAAKHLDVPFALPQH